MNPLISFFNKLFWHSPELRAMEDPTVYQIETLKDKYEGTILYQDDIVIKFNCNKASAVKILKSNTSVLQSCGRKPINNSITA
jgi:hypothetical protein